MRLRPHAVRWAVVVLLAVLLLFDAALATLAYRGNRPHPRRAISVVWTVARGTLPAALSGGS